MWWRTVLVSTLIMLPTCVSAESVSDTVEDVVWFGDSRSQKQHDWHYDLAYDDVVCKTELKYNAAEQFVFIGGLISKKLSWTSVDCAKSCFLQPQCKSANFYLPVNGAMGRCELNSESQYDNPSHLRPSQHVVVVYLDNIYCRDVGDLEIPKLGKPTTTATEKLKAKLQTHFS